MPASKLPDLVGSLLQGTYKVERLLGEGGMGVVYEASHVRLSRRFAVKVLFPEVAAHAEALARFRREAEVTSGLGHPHIVEVVDFNETPEGTPYIVMELLEGEDLETRLQRLGKLEMTEALSIFRQTASALGAAHERGVIHRDLKPPNIYLANRGGRDDWVKVVDFGISKVLGSRSVVTKTHTTMGTPSYMSPEQAEGRSGQVDARADIFALGTILYEMVAGRPPFVGESIPTVLYKIVHIDPPSLSDLRPDLPLALAGAVSRALAKDPAGRYESAAAFVAAVDEALPQLARASRARVPMVATPTPGASSPRAAPATHNQGIAGKRGPSTTLSGGAGEITGGTMSPPRSRLPLVIAASVMLAAGAGVGVWLATRGPTATAASAGTSAAAGSAASAGSAAGSATARPASGSVAGLPSGTASGSGAASAARSGTGTGTGTSTGTGATAVRSGTGRGTGTGSTAAGGTVATKTTKKAAKKAARKMSRKVSRKASRKAAAAGRQVPDKKGSAKKTPAKKSLRYWP